MNRIKELRLNAKLSQKELADLIGVNQTAVSQWERGATSPKHFQVQKLCQVFQVSDTYLLGTTDATKPPTSKDMSGLTQKQIKILEMMDQMTPEQQDEMVRQAEYQLWMQQYKKGDQ